MDNLNVIIPYRGRETQKENIIKVLHKFLSEFLTCTFRIYIVEQHGDGDFNKGCLLNIGFLETNKKGNNYYCFNDVDTLPKSNLANYSRPKENTIVHPYGHSHCISNMFLINPETYIKMNGFSTKFWGWGYEDTDFLLRAKFCNIEINRNNFSERFKSQIYYETDIQTLKDIAEKNNSMTAILNRTLFHSSFITPENTIKEGLSTTEYEIVAKEEFEKYTHIKCKINNINKSSDYMRTALEFYSFTENIQK